MGFKQPKKWTVESLIASISNMDSDTIQSFAELNFERLSSGLYRDVYLVVVGRKKVVLKLPRSFGDANSLEVDSWILSKKSKGLATILAYDEEDHKESVCKWIIAEYIPNLISFKAFDKLLTYLDFYRKNCKTKIPNNFIHAVKIIHDLPIHDIHEYNIGRRRDKSYVVLDYAG